MEEKATKQIWHQFYQGFDFHLNYKWTVKYNKDEDYAVPVKYYYSNDDGFVEERINYNYTFEKLGKDDGSFRLEDYCENFTAKKDCDVKK